MTNNKSNCRTCAKVIIDGQEASKSLDLCNEWVHSEKDSRKTRFTRNKTQIILLWKKDTFFCPSCFVECKYNF